MEDEVNLPRRMKATILLMLCVWIVVKRLSEDGSYNSDGVQVDERFSKVLQSGKDDVNLTNKKESERHLRCLYSPTDSVRKLINIFNMFPNCSSAI